MTLAIAKRKGTNAIDVAHRVSAKLDTLAGTLVPSDVQLTITRDYGETAAEKSNELLWHMLLAVISVIGAHLARPRPARSAVVFMAIPVTLALTLFIFYLYGYTLNRITLFALIFSIGILVDDAIVVVENIVRHARLRRGESQRADRAVALRAVDEVGNPTILATLTVVAAILPMAFVGGLMGPYMRPIPIGASAAMAFSLLVAFVVTPWAAVRLLKPARSSRARRRGRCHAPVSPRHGGRCSTSGRIRWRFLAGVVALLLARDGARPAPVRQGEDAAVRQQERVSGDRRHARRHDARGHGARHVGARRGRARVSPKVVNVQTYAGTASPYNFNGLVRHYFLRRGAARGRPAGESGGQGRARSLQSHEIAKRMRDRLTPIARRFGATLKVAEVPPGPPVLQTLVAEVYGPDAGRVGPRWPPRSSAIFEQTRGVVDVDWYVEDASSRSQRSLVDGEKAALHGSVAGRRGRAAADGGQRRAGRPAARRRTRKRTCRSTCACRAASERSSAAQSLRLKRRTLARLPSARVDARRSVAGPRREPLSQEPACR